MDYFGLSTAQTPAARPASSSANHSYSNPPNTQHTVMTVEGEEENSPTPVGTPLDHPGAISISTAFHTSISVDGSGPDIILVAADGVHFYAHRHRLLVVSANRMGNLIPLEPSVVTHLPPVPLLTILVPHPSEVLNVILHIVYGLSCAQYFPTLETVETALDALHLLYGVSIQAFVVPRIPIYQLILSFAPFRPLDAYALAARHALEELCVIISSHLLAYDLGRMSDSAAQKMGPLYLKRLFLLHQSRLSALRNILLKAPGAHPLVPGCSQEIQQQLTRAWALAAARLVWDVLPSVSTSALRSLLEPIGETTTCSLCISILQQRVQEVLYEWSTVKRTI